MKRFGPSRSEIRFRLWFSLAGLALLGSAVVLRGFPIGPAMFEVIVIAGAFFGGSAIWCLVALARADRGTRD